ncbi:MAG: DNA polymerase III subunit alpha [Clostridium sp.]
MSIKNYTALHNHDEFSVLDGYSSPKEYLDRVLELGMDSFAITNHGNQFSWVYYAMLQKESRYKNIKILYGVELYECFDINIKDKNSKYFHLVMIAKNEKGRILLNKIVTKSNLHGYYYKPRIDMTSLRDIIGSNGNDVIVTTACLASKIARETDYTKCTEYIYEYKELFPNFYLEMQAHDQEDQVNHNKKILKLANDTNTPFVITTDSHCARNEDLYYQGKHVQIAQDRETASECYEGCYLQSIDDIHKIMDKQIGYTNVNIGLDNTNKIKDKVDDVKMPFQEPQLPSFELPYGFKSDYDYLKHLLEKGWGNRNVNLMDKKHINTRRKRLEYELDVINRMKFNGYFLIVWDMINFAKNNGVMVGPGRGSGAGSYICYLLGITDIDPVKYGLIFERFLNEERISMPDLDIDFSDRTPIVEYLVKKYGEERVCQVINFSYITPLNAIKDSFRVLKFPIAISNKIAKRFSHETFEECLDKNPTIYEEYPEYVDAFDIARKISGRVRGIGIHAGGCGIVDTTIDNYIGMVRGGDGEQVIQVDKRVIEEIGIIKFDLLGVKTLKLVQDVLNDANINEWDININNPVFENDEKSYKLLSSANTNAVFQLESSGMKDLLVRLKPHNMEELSAVIALYRPDSMGALEEFIQCKHGDKDIIYIHDDMKSILGLTYGCLIYQEQLLEVVRKFGGRTYGGADKFRKGIGKKDVKIVQEESDKLYDEIINNNYQETIAKQISNDMRQKGGYLFNKSHSFCYAVLALQTAYLKKHYPLYFYKALFNLRKSDTGKLNKYIKDALDNNISVKVPHINRSELDFSIYDNSVLFGLSAISGVGDKVITPILEERTQNGLFKSRNDFVERIKPTETNFVTLVKSGAIPSNDKYNTLISYAKSHIGKQEYKIVNSLPTLLKLKLEWGIDTDIIKNKQERLRIYNEKKKELWETEQSIKQANKLELFKKKHLTTPDMWEFETLSVFLTNNPFEKYSDKINSFEDILNGRDCVIVGVVSNKIVKKNKNKQQYAYITLATAYGLVEVACWASQYSMYSDLIEKGQRLAILSSKNDDKYTVKELKTLDQWLIDTKI